MMEKRSAHARPRQQMGEVMRVTSSPDYPQKSEINPIKDDGSVGTTRLKATLLTRNGVQLFCYLNSRNDSEFYNK